ncbi:MAG: hypothetical protein QF721_12535, partial [Verrucomicrobiota bacterium]|nr:hypothetical protein [Verrucomicrobiota bacterium]
MFRNAAHEAPQYGVRTRVVQTNSCCREGNKKLAHYRLPDYKTRRSMHWRRRLNCLGSSMVEQLTLN